MLVLLATACHAIDLVATYAANSNLRQKIDPVYLIVRADQGPVVWTWLIGVKLALIVSGALLTWIGFSLTERFYPAKRENLGKFYVQAFYQRDISVAQSLYSLPKNYGPAVLLLGLSLLLISPYYIYVGYYEIAVIRGWSVAPAFQISGWFIDWTIIGIAIFAYWGAAFVAYMDYLTSAPTAAIDIQTDPNLQPQ